MKKLLFMAIQAINTAPCQLSAPFGDWKLRKVYDNLKMCKHVGFSSEYKHFMKELQAFKENMRKKEEVAAKAHYAKLCETIIQHPELADMLRFITNARYVDAFDDVKELSDLERSLEQNTKIGKIHANYLNKRLDLKEKSFMGFGAMR